MNKKELFENYAKPFLEKVLENMKSGKATSAEIEAFPKVLEFVKNLIRF